MAGRELILAALLAAASASASELDRLVDREEYVAAFRLGLTELERRSAAAGPRDPGTLASLERLGEIAHLSGDQNTAELLLDQALERRRERFGPQSYEVAETLYWRGQVARYVGDRATAWDCWRDALERLDRDAPHDRPLVAAVLRGQASWLRGVGLDAAARKYREALALQEQIGATPALDRADNLSWLAWVLAHAGRWDEALPLIERAEAELRRLGLTEHSLQAALVNLRADAAALATHWEEAERLYARTAELYERLRERCLPGFARRKVPLDGYDLLAYVRLMQGHTGSAWDALQRARSSLHVDFLALGRWRARDPASFARVQRLRRAYLDARREWERGQAWPVLLRRLALRAELYELERDFLRDHRPVPPEVRDVQRRLAPRCAFVGWLEVRWGGDWLYSEGPLYVGWWMYVLRADRPIAWIPLWHTSSAADYRSIRAPLDRANDLLQRAAAWPFRVEPDPELTRSLHSWSARQLDPALPHLAGVDTLIIEQPQGPLVEGAAPRFATAYVPSAAAYLLLSETAPRAAPQRVLAIGDPRVDALPRLPESGREARSVAALFPDATLLLGAEANEQRLAALAAAGTLARFDVIHIATHALSERHPERCALALTGGPLDAEEILYGWELNARVLTLSACLTARGSQYARGEFPGLTHVLLAAGARAVVASLWKVDDGATALLMERFYANLTGHSAPPLPAAQALAEARRWLRDYRDASGVRPFEHPVYWSGFILLGPPV
ncbi:MAG TPA: CHAT domain-containing tetratricopeptide repeat protein [Candidatus Polarisedimenticolaceae bacterium]|nr:CHAT domain-containing tetratricopeptide repeat protein [Candidatus Polarisedimenticolaceae bacterium]